VVASAFKKVLPDAFICIHLLGARLYPADVPGSSIKKAGKKRLALDSGVHFASLLAYLARGSWLVL